MNDDLIDSLLGKLRDGDVAAAEQICVAFEPLLRKIISRQLSPPLRAKFDSMDVVQSVFADLLAGLDDAVWRFDDAAALRAFLLTMVRNRFIDRVRQHRNAMGREQPIERTDSNELPASRLPRPSQVAQANDLWELMLAASPTEHHELLRLKREGRSLHEIATRTRLHEGSVRRILRELARKLAFKSRPQTASIRIS